MSGTPGAPLGPPPDPRAGRQRRLARFLRVASLVTFAAAAAALVLPGEVGRVAGGLAIALLVAAPLVRLAWLARRWVRRGDRRFAFVALLLGVIVLAGAVIGR
ncbi:MAG: hypothetical protein KDB10_10485 [Acidimicrobiales bacterium]|nr:hypothetical protein [Acidimicrobiales bacterium]